ncbi:MAG: type 4a pilus biogenesis protein PilO [Candidatus Nitrospinota bacterium M3_3B_026]
MDLDKLFEKVPYERLYPIPSWQRMGAVIGVAAVIVGIFYFVVIKGKDREIARLQQNLAKVKKEVEDNRVHTRDFSKLKGRMVQLEVDLDEATRQLPSGKEIPELLEQISNIGTQFGLEFLVFRPMPEIIKDFYSEVPVSVKVVGKFHNILMFFDEIASLPRIVTVKSIDIKSGKKETGITNLETSCEIVTYRFIEEAERKKKAAKNKKKK